jgi:hypothetical protein
MAMIPNIRYGMGGKGTPGLRERECGRGTRTISLDARLVLDEKVMTCPGSLLRSLAREVRESQNKTGLRMTLEKSVRSRIGSQSAGRRGRCTVRGKHFSSSMLLWHETLGAHNRDSTTMAQSQHMRSALEGSRRRACGVGTCWAVEWAGLQEQICRSGFQCKEVSWWCDV